KQQLILLATVKDQKSLIKYQQLPLSHTHIPLNQPLTPTNPFLLIYAILANHQSPSFPNHQTFQTHIHQLNSELNPPLSILIHHYHHLSTQQLLNHNQI
ncbi:hypothetical protein, partial [Staphylococcus epidermidis]|uniref:hypothetical protein n=1 Tax=Staphylococcus epidermidis TaxID=1282 RepID=UPI001C92E4C0